MFISLLCHCQWNTNYVITNVAYYCSCLNREYLQYNIFEKIERTCEYRFVSIMFADKININKENLFYLISLVAPHRYEVEVVLFLYQAYIKIKLSLIKVRSNWAATLKVLIFTEIWCNMISSDTDDTNCQCKRKLILKLY